jgi:ATP-dependent DNA helicase RecQ
MLQPTVLTAFTATAGEAITARIAALLSPGHAPHIIRANPDRPNITYSVLPSLMKSGDLSLLLRAPPAGPGGAGRGFAGKGRPGDLPSIPAVPRPALVFCRSRKSAELTAATLRYRLHDERIFFYHAGLEKREKQRLEEWFFAAEDGILAATTAYGMGVDKADIRTVIHRDLSPSVEAFLQESGRAGRDGLRSHSIMLLHPEEYRRAEYLRGSREGQRFSELLRICGAVRGCRRELLLALLGGEPEACFGCDLCGESLPPAARGEAQIMRLLRRRPLRHTARESAEILARNYPGVYSGGKLAKPRRNSWHADEIREDIVEAIESLKLAGLLKAPRRGPWRGLLYCSKSGRARARLLSGYAG